MDGEKLDDPYEQRLLSLYQSCLENNDSGLNENGLKLLCDKLELEDNGCKLIESLIKSGKNNPNYLITFDEFRNGLLNLLNNQNDNNDKGVIDVDDDNECIKLIDDLSSKINKNKLDKLNTVTLIRNSMINIPMETMKDILDKLFKKIDTDGLITFNEFLELFKTHNYFDEIVDLDSQWNTNKRINKIDQTNDDDNETNYLNVDRPKGKEEDEDGWINYETIINLWTLAGVNEPCNLLSDLNFTDGKINVSDLMNVLIDELKSLQHEFNDNKLSKTHINLLKGTLILYKDELKSINLLNEQLKREKDKLKVDIINANERINFLIQEIDENHIKLELTRKDEIKQLELKFNDNIKDLTLQFNNERELLLTKINISNEQLKNYQHSEQQLRNKLVDSLNDNQNLEINNQKLLDDISKLKNSNNQLLMQVQMLIAEHDEAKIDDQDEQNQHVISLCERIKLLQSETSSLRDQNDELTLQIESLKLRINTDDNNYNYNHNHNNYQQQSQKTKLSDKKILLQYLHPFITIVDEFKQINGCTSNCILKQNLSYIINKLELLIVNIVPTEQKNDSVVVIKSSESLKSKDKYKTTSGSLRDIVLNKNDKFLKLDSIFSSQSIENLDSSNNSLTKNNNNNNNNKTLRDYPPKKDDNYQFQSDERLDSTSESTSLNYLFKNDDKDDHFTLELIIKDRDKLKLLLKEQELKFNNDKKQLEEHCEKLKNDLELLRSEYYKCEDYWASKLEEERQLFEQEQKITDNKLEELITKIAEYEEQFSLDDKTRNDGRLSPIDERFNLEQQYNDLELEYDKFKTTTQQLIYDKDNEILALQQQLIDKSTSKVDCCTQIDNKIVNNSLKKLSEGEIKEENDDKDEVDGEIHPNQQLNYPQTQEKSQLEYNYLIKQKDNLMKEITQLEYNRSNYNNVYSKNINQREIKDKDKNYIKLLTNKLQIQQRKRKNLETNLKQQKQYIEQILQHTWKQHYNEITQFKSLIQQTQLLLQQQVQTNIILMEKLSKSDILLKDLYIENSYLKANLDRLDEHCHMLTQLSFESTSV